MYVRNYVSPWLCHTLFLIWLIQLIQLIQIIQIIQLIQLIQLIQWMQLILLININNGGCVSVTLWKSKAKAILWQFPLISDKTKC